MFGVHRTLTKIVDAVVLNFALLLAVSLRPGHPFSWTVVVKHPWWFVVITLLWYPIAYTFDAYDPAVIFDPHKSSWAAVKAGFVTFAIYLLIPYVTPAFPVARRYLFLGFLVLLLALAAERWLYALLFSHKAFKQRVLIVGAGWAGKTIAEVLRTGGAGSYEIAGFVDDEPDKQGAVIDTGAGGVKVLGSHEKLRDLVQKCNVSSIVLAVTRGLDARLLQALVNAMELGVRIIPMPLLYEELTGRVPIEHVGDNWYVALPVDHPGTQPLNRLVKRVSDIILASLGMLVLLPFLPFLMLAIYVDSPGPIFYAQVRVGKGGKLFKAYKFRSMVPDAEKDGKPVWAGERDPRVTRVGRVLRKMHVDEFPQFLNILKGEMSAVGPRPERPEFVEELAREIPFYRLRHAVKPGMAGWGLVKQGYGASKEDAFIKLQYDLYYIKHQSLWLDLVILLKTIVDTLTFGGR